VGESKQDQKGASCSIGGCTPCSYIAVFAVLPYSIFLMLSGVLYGVAFLAYGLIVGSPLLYALAKKAASRCRNP